MSVNRRSAAHATRHTKRTTTRLCSVESLEPRTVLAASPLGFLVVDSALAASDLRAALRNDAMLASSWSIGFTLSSYQSLPASARTSALTQVDYSKAIPLPVSPPKGTSSAAPSNRVPAPRPSEPKLPTPGTSTNRESGAEGESAGPTPVPPSSNPPGVRRPPVNRNAPSTSQSPSVPSTGAGLAQLPLAAFVYLPPASGGASDLLGDEQASPLEGGDDLGWDTLESGLTAASSPTGDLAGGAPLTSSTVFDMDDLTGWLDEVLLHGELPPLDGGASIDTEEGGLVDLDLSSPILQSSESQRAERTRPAHEMAHASATPSASDAADRENQAKERPAMVDQPAVKAAGFAASGRHAADPPATMSTPIEEEGGMIESLTNTDAWLLDADQPVVVQGPATLHTIEVRMDAEVGFHQTFELSTAPRSAHVRTQVTATP